MATSIGMINGGGSWIHTTRNKNSVNGGKGNKRRVGCSAVASAYSPLIDQYKTLRIQPGASEKDVKKAFRQLALQYHPDVCKGNNCGVQFHMINEAYDILMRNLRGETTENFYQPSDNSSSDGGCEEGEGVYDDGDLWEEWMGWEGAGIRDYSSHINPYI